MQPCEHFVNGRFAQITAPLLIQHKYRNGVTDNWDSDIQMFQVSVFGLGRVGLATAVCLAKKGYRVVGVDVDSNTVKAIQEGKSPFFEPRLEAYLKEVVSSKTFTATVDSCQSSDSDIAYITVGTPSNPDGTINLRHVEAAAVNIGESLLNKHKYQLIVVKSTVIPGTTRNRVRPAIEKSSGRVYGAEFGICTSPEFLREGHAIEDTENPDRIIIGSDDTHAAGKLATFHRKFTPSVPPERVILTTPENAELVKYANNAFLATKISLINSIASIAERVPNADVTVIAKGIGLDVRIGPQFLNAGLGWGGSCFPKDLKALVEFSVECGCDPQLIRATTETNQKQPMKAIEFARQGLGQLKGKRIAILGLSFKPDTDDMREAVSTSVINGLLVEGADVVAYDPAALQTAKGIFKDRIEYAINSDACLNGADLAILTTEWEEFKKLEPTDFLGLMRTPMVFDGRRIYDPEKMRRAGVTFGAIGLSPSQTSRIMI